jgi:hypothetical protein
MAGNFWINNNGINTLKGDPDAPARADQPVLNDEMIVNTLRTSLIARKDWNRMWPVLTSVEQARLQALIDENPWLTQLIRDTSDIEDAQQRRMNRIPVYTAGPRGGGGYRRQVLRNTYPTKKG